MNHDEVIERVEHIESRLKRARQTNDADELRSLADYCDMVKNQIIDLQRIPIDPRGFVDAANEILKHYTPEIRIEHYQNFPNVKHMLRWIYDYERIKSLAADTHMDLFNLLAGTDVRAGLHSNHVNEVLMSFAFDRVNKWLEKNGCDAKLTWPFDLGKTTINFGIIELRQKN